MIKIRKKIPLIDQHDKNGFWGGKFGGNFIPETLKKPVSDLENLFLSLGITNLLYMKETNSLRIG